MLWALAYPKNNEIEIEINNKERDTIIVSLKIFLEVKGGVAQ